MTPSAAHFKKLLHTIYRQTKDEDLRPIQLSDGTTKMVSERQILISCVIASAEAVEKLERIITEVVAPALDASLKASQTTATQAADATVPGAPTAPAVTSVEGEGDLPPMAASVVGATPTVPQGPSVVSVSAPLNITKPAGSIVQTSAPQKIGKPSAPA